MNEIAGRVEERIGRREQQARAAAHFVTDDHEWWGEEGLREAFAAYSVGMTAPLWGVHEDAAMIATHPPAWVLADCERDRRALARAVAQAARHTPLEEDGLPGRCPWCGHDAMACVDGAAADDALADLDAKYEAWRDA